jgi:hypothetical protein
VQPEPPDDADAKSQETVQEGGAYRHASQNSQDPTYSYGDDCFDVVKEACWYGRRAASYTQAHQQEHGQTVVLIRTYSRVCAVQGAL